jgi:hypothetical protein
MFMITVMDLDVYSSGMSGAPLVVLNACERGNLNPLYTSYFAAAFLRHGARGVVAAEGAVGDTLAAQFAEDLYGHLLAASVLVGHVNEL